MIVCFTGHRTIQGNYYDPTNLVGYWLDVWAKTVGIVHQLWQQGYTDFISGGALGFDQLAANAVLYNRNHQLPIKLLMALPFNDMEKKWPANSKILLRNIVAQADSVNFICPGSYAPWKMQERNKWMVDRSDKIVALYLPDKIGGTLNCLTYTMLHRKPILTIHPLINLLNKVEWDDTTSGYTATAVYDGQI